MAQDFYDVLGVSKSATKEEIKKAYYKLAHQHHPHKGGDEKKMKEINEAYAVLGNEEKRKQYDQFGGAFNQAGGFGGGFNDFASNFGGQGANVNFDFGDLGDIFGDFFGGSSRSRQRARGADIETTITINFEEAVFGTEKKFSLNKDVICNHCKGSGGEPGTKVSTCSTCRGTGQVVKSVGFGIGLPSTCSQCSGQGQQIEKKCTTCHGSGVKKEAEEIKVKIPAGIDDGQSIRLSGRGAAGQKGTPAGDLYLRINVAPDKRFVRNGYDLRSKAQISIKQAILGDKIEIETVDGKVKLKIPEGTHSGKVFRIKGKGVNHLQGKGRGDQLVEVTVNIPSKLSRKQKDLLKELDI